jgi:hypothetical protein
LPEIFVGCYPDNFVVIFEESEHYFC